MEVGSLLSPCGFLTQAVKFGASIFTYWSLLPGPILFLLKWFGVGWPRTMYLRMTLIFLPQSPMDWHYICRPPLSALRSLLRSGEPPKWSSRTRPPAAASLHSTPAGRVGRGGRMRRFRRPFPGDPEASAWTRVFAGWRERARGGGGVCRAGARATRMRSSRRLCEPSWEMAAAAVERRV